MSMRKQRKNSIGPAIAGARCAPSGTSTGPPISSGTRGFASDRAALPEPGGEALGDHPVAFAVGMDRVGLQARIPEHLADHALLVRQAELLRDGGVELGRGHAEARLR